MGGLAWSNCGPFHKKLGTQAEAISRMEALGPESSTAGRGRCRMNPAPPHALPKADLSSEMVYDSLNFRGLWAAITRKAAPQIRMPIAAGRPRPLCAGWPSRRRANRAGVHRPCAWPKRVDKLTGFWAIDEKPTGSKRPLCPAPRGLGCLFGILVEEMI